MSQAEPDPITDLEQRLARLERRLQPDHAVEAGTVASLLLHPGAAFLLGVVALASGYLGLGLPQHYYQPLFAGLILLLAYHRRVWVLPVGSWRWPQVGVNFCLMTLLFKLLIGAGMSYPLDWMKVPVITTVPSPEDNGWVDKLLPEFDMQWRAIPSVTDWNFDMTQIQTLLLIATLAGALFRFQPFASLTALTLLIVSIPSFMVFNWDWVILFLITGSVSLYMQSLGPYRR